MYLWKEVSKAKEVSFSIICFMIPMKLNKKFMKQKMKYEMKRKGTWNS